MGECKGKKGAGKESGEILKDSFGIGEDQRKEERLNVNGSGRELWCVCACE